MKKFEQCTYRSQVKRLRELAVLAVKQFPIRVASIQLINHGENTTFKVTAPNRSKFLLRVHRDGYHSLEALKEELRWLKQLSRDGLHVPQPIGSLAGRMIESVNLLSVGVRSCDMFHWIDGRFLSKSISTQDMFKIGVLLANTQFVGHKMKVRHRRYWLSEGLVGADPKFGSIDQLPGLRADEQTQITATRKRLLGKLKRYEKLYPEKLGLIHADLHFSNLLKTKKGEIAAIDFDDCGYGFHIYDLAIPLIGAEYHLRQHKRFRDYKKLKKALIEGYATITQVTDDDLRLLQDLIVARQLLMLGWLQSRSDNPKLRDVTAKRVRKTLSYIAKPWL